ncbi:MAG TPA: response regulator transcription factor [Thermoleophilaceae bacterium]|nr:response regulator transcription factor [Thermoleophilaceae bacterium]
MSRILIAEDEPRLASFLEKGLKANGYVTTVVADGHVASIVARDDEFDLMILDIGLPRMDGFHVLKSIRERGQRLPVIVLTARDDVEDKVRGLEGGADDYVTKPFRFEELLARVRVRLRTDGRDAETVLEVGPISLDLRSRKARAGDAEVTLTAREFTLLETFMRHPGQMLSREQLLSHVWGYDYDPGSNIVDVYIGYLRRKLGDDSIETVRGMGYRLRAEAS